MRAISVKHKITISEYIAMFAGQDLSLAPRTELIDGEVFELTPLGFKHLKTQQLFLDFLQKVFSKFDVYPSGSVLVDQYNMPEPDILVMKSNEVVENNYPNIKQLSMVVEISDSTAKADLANDGSGKLALYASGGVPIVWVVDINDRAVHEFTDPQNAVYKNTVVHKQTVAFKGVSEQVDQLIA